MKIILKKWLVVTGFIGWIFLVSCNSGSEKSDNLESTDLSVNSWELKPFIKVDSVNPILNPAESLTFYCPVRNEIINWAEKDVFNPAAVFLNDSIYLIFRAEDVVGKFAGTSRLGLATSKDGLHFTNKNKPVLYPDNDPLKIYEWEGGCEDPRIVEDENRRYFLTYTAWDGKMARLAIASSKDLQQWDKHGLVFERYKGGRYINYWSKSGSIVCKKDGNRLIATKIKGMYWMYWGDTNIYLAQSENLIDWQPIEAPDGSLVPVFGPRKGYFDSDLVEPGPPAILMEKGIWMIYNSRNNEEFGDPEIPSGTYTAGQILLDSEDPARVIARSEKNFFRPENEYEITGQVGNVCFLEALVPVGDRWFLYYGTADSKIAVAVLNGTNLLHE
jgi:predicted GH43/DUF377 family glycosyl hydrolase